MSFSRRRPVVLSYFAALAFGAVTLTAGCGDDGSSQAGTATPGASAAISPSVTPPVSATPPAPEAPSAPAVPPTSAAPAIPPAATVAPPAPPSGTPASPSAPSAPTSAAPFSGTKQFVEIEKAWTADGQTFVSVRPARKEAMTQPHEAWIVVPGTGPYVTVPLAANAQVLLAAPLGDSSQSTAYSQAEFVSRMAAQPPAMRPNIGFDLSFDGAGRVTRVASLYTS